MNTGAAAARGDLLWFLHLDAEPPPGAVDAMLSAVARGHVWGRFDVRLSGAEPMLRVVERMMNLRSRLTGIATGDQGIFVVREVFERAGGYPVIALMEDIALSKRLKRVGRPACLRQRIVASSRRWEQAGIWRTIVLMWRLRLGYWLGVDPATLARRYDAPRVTDCRRGLRDRISDELAGMNPDEGDMAAPSVSAAAPLFPRARVLLFAKAPVPGQVKTRMIPALGADGAAALARAVVAGDGRRLSTAAVAPLELWCAPDTRHALFGELAETPRPDTAPATRGGSRRAPACGVRGCLGPRGLCRADRQRLPGARHGVSGAGV